MAVVKPGALKAAILNIAVLAVSIFVAVLLAELVARRVYGVQEFPPYYVGEFENRESRNFQVDPHTGWRMRGEHTFRWTIGSEEVVNTYTSNAAGFRSDVAFGKRDSIVLIGDSFTFGTGVEYQDTFGSVLERRLDRLPVFNLAMPGFGLDQMWMALRHQADEFQPRLLVVAFVDKDLDRSLTAYREAEGMNKPVFLLEDGVLRPQTAKDRPPDWFVRLDRGLALSGVLRENTKRLGYTLPVGEWWTLNAQIFRQMMEDARSREVPLLFVRLPFRGEREFPTLTAFMAAEGAYFLDVEALSNTVEDETIFIAGDNHINEAGHEMVADALLRWVDEQLPQLK